MLFSFNAKQFLQSKSTAAAIEEHDFAQNLPQAKPFEEMPTLSKFELVRSFLPGGKYNNLDSSEFLLALKRDYGDICRIPGIFGQPPVVYTHNVEDFETIYRNDGVWPTRPGLTALKYYRSVYRKDFFQGVEALLPT